MAAFSLLGSLPQQLLGPVRQGFSVLAKLPAQHHQTVGENISKWIDPAEPDPGLDAVARRLQVTETNFEAVGAAIYVLVNELFTAETSRTPEEVVELAAGAGRLASEDVEEVLKFCHEHLVPRRLSIGAALARTRSSQAVLPSYVSLSSVIDLRTVAFDDHNRVVMTVPVVIARLHTTEDDADSVFQMTAEDVDELSRELADLARKLAAANESANLRAIPRDGSE